MRPLDGIIGTKRALDIGFGEVAAHPESQGQQSRLILTAVGLSRWCARGDLQSNTEQGQNKWCT